MANDVKKSAVVGMVFSGTPVDQAASMVGMTRQAIYQDPKYGPRLKAASASRRGRRSDVRPGRVVGGELEADGGDDGEDGESAGGG
jgi:hypothetical protein